MKYKLIKEDALNAYILNTETNYVVALCHTKRPDLGFWELQGLINEANDNIHTTGTTTIEFTEEEIFEILDSYYGDVDEEHFCIDTWTAEEIKVAITNN